MTNTTEHTGAAAGYELTIYRISRDCNADLTGVPTPKGPLLFIHGFASDASDWWKVSDSSKDHIGLQYAKEGFDVYYANLRGSAPSLGHSDPRFDADGNP